MSFCFCTFWTYVSPVTDVATAILVCRTTGTTADSIDILITLAAVLGEVYTSAEHTADVSVPLIETLLDNCIDER